MIWSNFFFSISDEKKNTWEMWKRKKKSALLEILCVGGWGLCVWGGCLDLHKQFEPVSDQKYGLTKQTATKCRVLKKYFMSILVLLELKFEMQIFQKFVILSKCIALRNQKYLKFGSERIARRGWKVFFFFCFFCFFF